MSGCNKSPKNDQHSIKYRWIQQGGASSKDDISRVDCSPPQLNPPEILTTPQLISAIGQLWVSASRPLSFLLPKENVDKDNKGFSKEKILGNIHENKNGVVTSNNTNYYSANPGATCFGSQVLQEKLDFPKVTQKMLILESSYGSQDYIHSLFHRFSQASDQNSNEYCDKLELGSEEISFRSGNVPSELNCHAKVTEPENLKTNSLVASDCISIDAIPTSLANERDVCNPDVLIREALALSNDAVLNTKEVNPLCSDYFLQVVPDNQMDVDACQTLSSSIYADYHIINSLATCNTASVQCQCKIDDNESELMEIQRSHLSDITDDEPKLQIFSATNRKPSHSLAKQEHAFSGALAGICVSCCLHPVDTIKTVVQSCRAEQRSIFYIGKSIVSDRGFPGLYRGITTNIACSAPISAVYTFTYESVKGALVPYLPKENYSVAHCVGGGCASIATSFIFTPSERIKQQMQVGSHYRNCWDVLIGIIRNGGLSSLYAGWRAVLCRNIPHSMIKFYTYESLKQVMPSSSIQSHTFQTLVCGGLAGSTAALFTTPFDVIKTRLQTQIPGSRNQYDSVFHALYKISKTEGLKGLYRGLTPRLIMYMSQGSLFFASYEFFKSVFSLEASLPTGL
ncbi:S-adenosylmethionine carrier 1, chloroplastic/mitochondrial [Trifolium repens]|nr:S-adenosylmethionine carrier 1, chloroplastic/mitochondrial [Trifolium repens]